MKFFLSSTAYDLYDFRALVIRELEAMGHEVLYHEMPTFSAIEPVHSHDACLMAVQSAQAVICLLDKRYGGTYSGAGQSYIKAQKVSVRVGRERQKVTVRKKELSITWCELLAARHFKKPMLTFARKRLLDEKATRRKNQNLEGFLPAYADNNRMFDLLDWLTQQKTYNWISFFDSVVEFRKQLVAWVGNIQEELASDQVDDSDDATKLASLSHVLVIVEGRQDRQFVRFLIDKLKVQAVFAVTVAPGGKGAAEMKWIAQSRVRGSVFDGILLLVDSDGNAQSDETRLQKIKDSARDERLQFALADSELESWILAGLERPSMISDDESSRAKWLRQMPSEMRSDLLKSQYNLDLGRRNSPSLNRFCELLLRFGSPSSPAAT